MTTEVDICNRALSRLGTAATIASLDEDSTEARHCAIWYAATRDALLRAADWNFARRREELADMGSPPTGWDYRYAVPTDCVRVLRLASATNAAPLPFEIAGASTSRVLFTDQEDAELIYTARVEEPTLFDAGFAAALVDQLAANIAYPITQKTEIAVRLAQMARSSFEHAVASDANEQVASAEALPESLAVRGYDGTDLE